MEADGVFIVQELRYWKGEPREEGWRDVMRFETIEKARRWIKLFGSYRYDYRIQKELDEAED